MRRIAWVVAAGVMCWVVFRALVETVTERDWLGATVMGLAAVGLLLGVLALRRSGELATLSGPGGE